MQIQTWKITGQSFHFGRHGLGQEETNICLPSDSLFSALVARLVEIEGEAGLEVFMTPFLRGEPPFILSSTFPCAGEILFFPVPRSLHAESSSMSASNWKKVKTVKYLSEGLFRQVLSGKPFVQLFEESLLLQNGAALVSKEENTHLPGSVHEGKKLWSVETRPRVTLGRILQNSSIYSTGTVTYASGCGLWFGVRWLKEDARLKDQAAGIFADLGVSGLGAERSVGLGACQFVEGPSIELLEADGKAWVSLSRYLPRSVEMHALMDEQASYSIVNIGGWLDSPVRRGQRRRSVNMLIEGSVFGKLERVVPGEVVDVRPKYASDPDPLGHAVYRCGLALAVGL